MELVETFTGPDWRIVLALPLIAGFGYYIYLCYLDRKNAKKLQATIKVDSRKPDERIRQTIHEEDEIMRIQQELDKNEKV